MKIKYYAHSCFGITSADGTTVVTDPYEPGCFDGAVGFAPVEAEAKVVTISHDHPDHNYSAGISSDPEVVTGSGQAAGIDFQAVNVKHDESDGSERGDVMIFCWEMDGMKVCHLGDLGHELSDEQAGQLNGTDVLLLPVGGHFTIDAKTAKLVVDKIKPRIVIPMHFKVDKLNFPLATIDVFLEGKENVKKAGSSELEITKESLPASTEIVVLEQSR